MKYERYLVKGKIDSDVSLDISEWMDLQDKDNFKLTVEAIKSKRNSDQNDLYWKVLRMVKDASYGWGGGQFDDYLVEDFHDAISAKYLQLRDKNGNVVINPRTKEPRVRSTTSLTVNEFAKHVDMIIQVILVGTFGGVFEKKHEKLYLSTMGVKK